jgi:hypothetical protein
VLLFQAILLFLFPLGAYCLLLAHVNRRDRPLLLAGSWDGALMLGAGSGFFLILLPTIFLHLYHRSIHGAIGVEEDLDQLLARWWFAWFGYYVLLVAGSVALVAWRRHKTVIYNVDTELFPALFVQAARLAQLDVHAHPEQSGHYVLSLALPPATAIAAERLPPLQPAGRPAAVLVVDPYPAGCHVTVHWQHYSPAVRLALEEQLAKTLEQARPADNPLAGWFLVISGLVFGLIALVVLAVYLQLYFRHR